MTSRTWHEPVYDVTYTVLQIPFAELSPWLTKTYGDDLEGGAISEEPTARCYHYTHPLRIVFWFSPKVRGRIATEWAGTIAHEATHAAMTVLRDRGLKLKDASEEALCYYVGYLVAQITQRVKA